MGGAASQVRTRLSLTGIEIVGTTANVRAFVGTIRHRESQAEKILSFVKSQEKMEVFKVYSDPGFTGANLERPGLQEMLKEMIC